MGDGILKACSRIGSEPSIRCAVCCINTRESIYLRTSSSHTVLQITVHVHPR